MNTDIVPPTSSLERYLIKKGLIHALELDNAPLLKRWLTRAAFVEQLDLLQERLQISQLWSIIEQQHCLKSLFIQQWEESPFKESTHRSLTALGNVFYQSGRVNLSEALLPFWQQWSAENGWGKKSHLDWLTCKSMVFQHRSQPQENALLQHQILEQTIEIFGEEAVETTLALNNYGCTLQALGKGEEGNSYLERCLAIRQRRLGTEHEESLITESNIWVLHLLNRDWKKAILIGDPLTDRIEQALGKGWVYLNQINGLGVALASHGLAINDAAFVDRAQAYWTEIVNLSQQIGLQKSQCAITAQSNICWILSERKDERALEETERLLEQKIVAFGEDSTSLIPTYCVLLQILDGKGEFHRCLEVLDTAMALAHRILPEDHQYIEDLLSWMISAHEGLENWAEVVGHRQHFLKMRVSRLGEGHLRTNRSRYKLAQALLNMDSAEEALCHFQQVLSVERELHGSESSKLAVTHWYLAICLRELSRPIEAAEHRRCCWELERTDAGITDPNVLDTAIALVGDLIAAVQWSAALEVIDLSIHACVDAESDPERKKRMAQLEQLRTDVLSDLSSES